MVEKDYREAIEISGNKVNERALSQAKRYYYKQIFPKLKRKE